jgi:hypothetical protein
MSVFASLHAEGLFIFQGFAIIALLGIIAGMLVCASRCIQGKNIRGQFGLCLLDLSFEFGNPDIDGVRRHCSGASANAKPMQHRKHKWSALSCYVIGEACNPDAVFHCGFHAFVSLPSQARPPD